MLKNTQGDQLTIFLNFQDYKLTHVAIMPFFPCVSNSFLSDSSALLPSSPDNSCLKYIYTIGLLHRSNFPLQ